MNGYDLTICCSNYTINLLVMAEDKETAFEAGLYTLINSEPKLDLFDMQLTYEAKFIEVIPND